jgi:hypothetical protein
MFNFEKLLVNDMFLDLCSGIKRGINCFLSSRPKFGFGLPTKKFFKLMFLMNPSAYGQRIEKYIIHISGLEGVSRTLDRGDSKNSFENHFEGKASYKDANNNYSLISMREWQELTGYYFALIDPDNDFNYDCFYLTNEEALKEAQIIGRYIQGTKEIVAKNTYTTKKMTFKEGSADHQRWLENYKTKDMRELIDILNTDTFTRDCDGGKKTVKLLANKYYTPKRFKSHS